MARLSERELWAREECVRRGIASDDICADGGIEAWMVVALEIMPDCTAGCRYSGECDGSCANPGPKKDGMSHG